MYAPEDPAEHWYRLVSGMARKCAIKADGRRQIVDFLLPGDFFGLITRHAHRFAVEAVVDGTEVARYPRGKIERLADFDPRIGRVIREAAFEATSRSQARMLILGRMSAQERVGAFLIEMAERSHDGGREGVVLLMSRVVPRVDIRETDQELEVVAELPGMDEADVDVSVSQWMLTIRGEKKSEREQEDDGYVLRERSFGRVERIVPLPDGLDVDSAQATFRNGVLTVRIPKTAETQRAAKRISVQRE